MTLHVTNGDVAVARIRQAAVDGEIVPWQDALTEGPVPAGLDEVPPAAFELASAAWTAFRAPDPAGIEWLLARDTSALPHLDSALRRHLEEFPWIGNGLSRTERQTLEALACGARTVREAFPAAHHACEEAVFLGDVGFLSIVRRLSEATAPLVRRVGGGTLRAPADPAVRALQIKLLDAELELTEAGEAVLDGKTDHVALNGVDRWLGGVHLEGREALWRWDASAARLVR